MRRAQVKNAARILIFLTLPGCASKYADSKALHPGPAETRSITEVAVAAAGSNSPVVVVPEVLHGFGFLYQHVTDTEFVLCLEGSQYKGHIYITGFRLALITKTTINTVSYEPCTSSNYIGTAHNHPPDPSGALCMQSSSDWNSFRNDARAVVDIILCGNSRYLWVLKDGRSSVDDGTSRVRQLLAKAVR
jgi:hypothetical protein